MSARPIENDAPACVYCDASATTYRLDVDGETFCSLACQLKRQTYGNKVNEELRAKDPGQGSFWFE